MGKVFLTGGNGCIAAHVIRLLLEDGHKVTTSVRNESKAGPLREKYHRFGENLKFAIVPDILKPDAFKDALLAESFDCIMHTASPVTVIAQDPVKEILEPAVQGTTGILKNAAKYAPTVKRIVLLSSFAAICDFSKGNRPGYVYTDEDWSPITWEMASLDGSYGYVGSKIFSERAAWEFMQKEKPQFDLVTICPPVVYGPIEHHIDSLKNLNVSTGDFYRLFSGEAREMPPVALRNWVDVRDLARALVRAYEKQEAGGQRFIVSEGNYDNQQVADYIWKHYPKRAATKDVVRGSPGVYLLDASDVYTADNSKSKKVLGIEYRGFESQLRDLLESFEVLEREGK